MRPAGRIAALSMIVAASVSLAVGPGRAAEPEKPEKITIDNIVWNPQTQAIDLTLRVRIGTAIAGDAAGFTFQTTMQIEGGPTLGSVAGRLTLAEWDKGRPPHDHGLVVVHSSLPGGGYVPLGDPDRAIISARLYNAAGRQVAETEALIELRDLPAPEPN